MYSDINPTPLCSLLYFKLFSVLTWDGGGVAAIFLFLSCAPGSIRRDMYLVHTSGILARRCSIIYVIVSYIINEETSAVRSRMSRGNSLSDELEN